MWSWWEISYVRYVSFHNVSNYWTSTTNKLTATTGSIDQLALCLVFDSVIYCVPFVSHPVTLLLFRGFCCLFIPSPCLTIPGWFIPSPCLTIPGWSFCPFTHLFCCFQAQIFHRISLNNLIIAITATTHANIPHVHCISLQTVSLACYSSRSFHSTSIYNFADNVSNAAIHHAWQSTPHSMAPPSHFCLAT